MEDKIFGSIEYSNNAWRKSIECTIFDRKLDLNIRIQDDKKDGILDIQRKAYQDYLNNMDRYVLEVPKYMLNYYKWNFEEINKVVALN